MGPQHIAAENVAHHAPHLIRHAGLQWGRSTSLRKTCRCRFLFGSDNSFNGAAAHRCGKRRTRQLEFGKLELQWGRSTSLRKTSPAQSPMLAEYRFNGAAAHRCGKPSRPRKEVRDDRSFNGAAAHRCGKHVANSERPANHGASMGPQHIAAENTDSTSLKLQHNMASMGPQHIAAENRLGQAGTRLAQAGFNGAAAHRCGKPARA